MSRYQTQTLTLEPSELGLLDQLLRADLRKQRRNLAQLAAKFGAEADLSGTEARITQLGDLRMRLRGVRP